MAHIGGEKEEFKSLLKKILEEKVAIRCEYLKPARMRERRDNVCHNQQLEEQFSHTDYRKMSFFPPYHSGLESTVE